MRNIEFPIVLGTCLLLALAESKKFGGTKAGERARKELARIKDKA